MYSQRYTAYLQSDAWRQRREKAIQRAGRRCERCFVPERVCRLEVHHITYERLGQEWDIDLEVVCPRCHINADDERRNRDYPWEDRDRRVRAWAAKVYGENWQDTYEYEDMELRFERWLERRGED